MSSAVAPVMMELRVPACNPDTYLGSSCGTTLKDDSRAASPKVDDLEDACIPTLCSAKPAKTYRFANMRSHDFFHTFVCGFTLLVAAAVYGLYTPIIPYQLAGQGRTDVGVLTGYFASAYAGGLIISSPATGYLGKRFEDKRSIIMTLIGILALSDVLLVLKGDIPSMMAARCLQGIATAGIWTVAIAVLVENVSRSKAGILSAIAMVLSNAGILMSQAIAGTLYTATGWRSIGFLGLSLCIANLIACSLYLTKAQVIDGLEFNEPRAIIMQTAVPQTSTAISNLKAFITNKRHVAVNLIGMFYALFISGLVTTALSLVVVDRYGLTAAQTSLCFLAISLPAASVAPLGGWITDRFGARWALIVCLCNFTLWHLVALIPRLPLPVFILVLIGLGLAQGTTLSPLFTYMACADRASRVQLGTSFLFGAWNFTYAIAALIFPLVCGTLVQKTGITIGWNIIVGTLAALSAMCIIVVIKYIEVLWLPDNAPQTVRAEEAKF